MVTYSLTQRREPIMDVWIAILAVVGTALTAVGGVATGLFTWLRVRENARLTILEEKVRCLTEDLAIERADKANIANQLKTANTTITVLTRARDRQRLEIFELTRRLNTLQKATESLTAVIVVNEFGHVTDWSPEATLMFHYTSDQTIGRDVSEMIVPAWQRGQHKDAFAALVRSGRTPRTKPIDATGMNAQGQEFKVIVALGTPWPVDNPEDSSNGSMRYPAKITMPISTMPISEENITQSKDSEL